MLNKKTAYDQEEISGWEHNRTSRAEHFLRQQALDLRNVWTMELFKQWVFAPDAAQRGLRAAALEGAARIQLYCRFMLASLAVLGRVLMCLGRVWRLPGTLSAGVPVVFAIHAEDSTRSRHMLPLLSEKQSLPVQVILLGAPSRQAHARMRALLSLAGQNSITCIYPWTTKGILRQIQKAPEELRAGLRNLTDFCHQTGWQPRVIDCSGIIYRRFAGNVMADWWQQQNSNADLAVFGHTGTADTCLLEAAMQQSGLKTMHVLHGVTAGYNFWAKSSIALCTSKYEAGLTARLGGYAKAVHIPSIQPAIVSRTRRILIASNYLHPQNPSYQKHGVRDEITFIRNVLDACNRLNIGSQDICWKAHPVFDRIPAAQQRKILDFLAEQGIAVQPARQAISQVIGDCMVISTLSTAAFDILRTGTVPILYLAQPADDALFHAAWLPGLKVRTSDQIVAALELLMDDPQHALLFQQTWDALGPGAPPDTAFILQSAND